MSTGVRVYSHASEAVAQLNASYHADSNSANMQLTILV